MQEHIHTGFGAVVFAGVSAIIVIQVVRLGSAWMIHSHKLEGAGRVLGGLVTFS